MGFELDVLFGPRTDAGALPEPVRAAVRREAEALLAGVTEFEAESKAVSRNPELTQAGKEAAFARLRAKHLAPVVEVEREIVKLEDEIEAIRERAVAGFDTMTTNPNARPRDTVSVLEEQEVRAQLRAMDSLLIYPLYLEAAQTGADPVLIAAIERAPRSFPIFNPPLSEDMVHEIERAKIARSPLREGLAAKRVRRSILQYVVGVARQHIGAAAEAIVFQ
jgi:hypothetical protein